VWDLGNCPIPSILLSWYYYPNTTKIVYMSKMLCEGSELWRGKRRGRKEEKKGSRGEG
jgi:hypothetical protein